jgi:hypothetical protein
MVIHQGMVPEVVTLAERVLAVKIGSVMDTVLLCHARRMPPRVPSAGR